MIWYLGKDHTTSVEEREAFIRESATYRIGPHVYIQTCNRVAVYGGEGEFTRELLIQLCRVTSGLDSHMVGEKHIQGQVKKAYLEAIAAGQISSGLHRLFQTALRIGKLVRTQTGISIGAVTHSMAVVELLRLEFGDLSSRRVLVVGAHHTNSRILELLRKQGCTSLFISNRTADAALKLASAENCQVVLFEELKAALNSVDVVVCATASLNPIITIDMIEGNRPLIIIDIAVPRDVEPAVGGIAGVRLFSIDAVESRIDQNLERRLGEIVRAQELIETDVAKVINEKNIVGITC